MRVTVICAVIVLRTSFAVQRGDICTTPNNEIARCVSLKVCPKLSDALKLNRTGIKEYAQKSLCGFDSEALVCCGTTIHITSGDRAFNTDALPNRTVLEREDICTTPNNEIARCVSIKLCPKLSDALKLNRTGIKEYAQKSLCGYDSEALVCCGTTIHITPGNRAFNTDALPNRTVCGLEKAGGFRIIHGDQTHLKEFPWMAALEYRDKMRKTIEGIKCTGSVINSKYVLTAAHCIVSASLELIRVWLGEWKISTDPDCENYGSESICADPVQKFSIEKEIPHPLFNPIEKVNDIGLLRLAKEITYTDYIIPICLPEPLSAEPDRLTWLTVAGWGVTENSRTSDIKLKIEIPFLSNNACRNKLKTTITSRQLCAGGQDRKDACRGDSGGPLMRFYQNPSSTFPQWHQEGIVSWGIGCAFPDYPGVYTKVSTYMNWIINIISEPGVSVQIQPQHRRRVPDYYFKTDQFLHNADEKTIEKFLAQIFQ